MKRHQLEHVLRAAGAVTNSFELIVIGSQAILAAVPDPPALLLVSEEADLYVPGREDLSVLIDGTIGNLSPFHQAFGYYGHGVGPTTAKTGDGVEVTFLTFTKLHEEAIYRHRDVYLRGAYTPQRQCTVIGRGGPGYMF